MAETTSQAGVREVLGRGWIYTLASASPMLAGVLLVPITTRVLDQQQYGLVALSLVVLQVGNVLLSLGLPLSVTRHALMEASGVAGARGVVVVSVLTSVGLGALAILTGPLWGEPVLGERWGPAFACAVASAVGGAVIANTQAFFRAVGRAWTFVALASAPTFFGPLAGIVAMLVIAREPQVYLAGLASVTLVGAAIGVLVVVRSGEVSLRGAAPGRALRVGLPTVPHQLSLSLASSGLVLIAARLHGLEAGARLQVALSIGVVAVVITQAINNAWVPLVLRTRADERVDLIDATARAIGWVAAAGSTALGMLAPWAVRFLAPPTYPPEELVPVVAVVSATAVLAVVYLASSHLVFVSGRTWPLALTTPASLGCGLGAAVVMGTAWGSSATGAGFAVTYGALGALTMLISRRISSGNWSVTVLLGPLLLAAAGALGACLLPFDGVGAVVRVVVAVAVLAAAGRGVLRQVRR